MLYQTGIRLLCIAQNPANGFPARLLGSRAAGDHRPDSDVDLMAVCPDEAAVLRADEVLRQLLEGKYEMPVVNVITIPREEFRRTALLAQSQAGQAARHGVPPDGKSMDYRPEREPKPEDTREAGIFWLTLTEAHLEVWPESHWPGFALRKADVFKSYMA